MVGATPAQALAVVPMDGSAASGRTAPPGTPPFLVQVLAMVCWSGLVIYVVGRHSLVSHSRVVGITVPNLSQSLANELPNE